VTIVARKRAAVDRLNATYADVRWQPGTFRQRFDDALRRTDVAPRVEVPHIDYPAFEAWLAARGWYVFERAVHPWNNTFSVVARRCE
jgi:hypothetical protein